MNPPIDRNFPLKNNRKHNFIISQFLIPYALISISFSAYATWEWQLSQHILCILLLSSNIWKTKKFINIVLYILKKSRQISVNTTKYMGNIYTHLVLYSSLAFITDSSHCPAPPGRLLISIRRALVGRPNAYVKFKSREVRRYIAMRHLFKVQGMQPLLTFYKQHM